MPALLCAILSSCEPTIYVVVSCLSAGTRRWKLFEIIHAVFSDFALMTRASCVAGVLIKVDQFRRRRVQQAQQRGAQNVQARQIGQRHDRRLFEPLIVQIAEFELQLVKLRAKILQRLRGGGNVLLPGDHGNLSGQRAVQFADAGFLGRDAGRWNFSPREFPRPPAPGVSATRSDGRPSAPDNPPR